MKTEFEPEDIKAIAAAVAEMLKPYLLKNNRAVASDTVVDVEELAKYLKVDTSWVYKQVSLRNIPHFKLGKYPRFKKLEIDRWINKNTMMPIPPLKMVEKRR